ncbi:phospholipase D-like domain-containing protein [Candidatus Omnitrophota bacterium]
MNPKISKTTLLIFIISLLILFIPLSVSAEVLFGEAYQESLHKHLIQAQESITVAMYFIILEPKGTGPINELVNDLIDAKDRGVSVKVVLEDSKLNENRLAYEKLRKSNIVVYFDTPKRLLHIKGVAIDDKYLFMGSANWSRAAIEDNYEATYFKDSSQDAIAFKQYVDNIPFQDKDIFLPSTTGVAISSDFILSHKLGRKLLKNQARKQLDLYLLLCKMQQEKKEANITIDYNSLAKEMNYVAPKDLGKYRNEHNYFYERIHRSLTRLRKYGFINYKKGVVTLNADMIKQSDKPSIVIPFEYWQYDYSDHLSTRAKYMYLISLYEATRSTRYPFWFRSQKDMATLYGISDTTISLGLLELEEKGIIKITRDKPTSPDFSDRKANVYKMLYLTHENN